MSCCKIMLHLIFSKVSNQTSCLDIMADDRTGSDIMADDRTGSVRDVCSMLRSQSIAIDERFLCS